MKRIQFALTLATTTIALLPFTASAQTSEQLRSCRDYVANVPEFSRNVSTSDIDVRGGDSNSREATVYWQVRGRRASGYCIVNRRNAVVEYRRQQGGGNYDSAQNSDVDDNWGQRVRQYRTRVVAGPARELLSRPDRRNAEVVDRVDGGERVTVYRSYRDNDNTIWLLVRGSNNQEGWINSRRLEGGGGTYGGNPDVDYNYGQDVRPYTTQVASGQARELQDRPTKDRAKTVDRVNGGDQVTVYRSYRDNDNTTWLLVKGPNGQEGWINSRRLEGESGDYGNNRDVDYNYGRDVRPFRTRVESGAERELLSQPNKNRAKEVGRVQGGERVTVYRTYSDGDIDWVLVRGSNDQEGWINSQRLQN